MKPDVSVFFSDRYGPLLSARFVKMFDVISLTMVARFDFLFGPKEFETRLQCPQAVEIGEVMNAPAGEELFAAEGEQLHLRMRHEVCRPRLRVR